MLNTELTAERLSAREAGVKGRPFFTPRRIHLAFWFAAIFFGGIEAAANRHAINSDGVTYLDMGDALFHGDWKGILNCLWSPLYPALLGLGQFLFKPSPYWEFSVAHLTNFVIYLFALLAFTFLLRTVVGYVRIHGYGLPEWSLLTLGYSIFIWSSLCLIDLAQISPDMTLSVFLYTAVALLLRIRSGKNGWFSYAALGLSLGLGFLAKAPLGPVAIVCLLVSIPAAGEWWKGFRGAVLATCVAVLVLAPYTVELSRVAGRTTFGDSAALNYAWHVNVVPLYHWRGEIPGTGTPKHPTRRLLADPAVYEFGTPIHGTYPLWFDIAYWSDGLRPRFRIADQLIAAYECTSEYLNLFLGIQGALVLGIVLLLFAGAGPGKAIRNVFNQWPILAAPVTGLAMYQLIHFEPRYIGAYVVVLWIGLLAAVHLDDSPSVKRLVSIVTLTLAAMLMIRTATNRLGPTIQNLADIAQGRGARSHSYWQVAEGLKRMGIRPDDSFAIFKTRPDAYYWARVAHVRVIAELPATSVASFWSAGDDTKVKVMDTLASTGVRAVVAREMPPHPGAGWQMIGNTGYWVYFFRT